MKKQLFILLFLFFGSAYITMAQSDLKHIREGNKDFKNQQYKEAEIKYRKALEENPNNYKALYNLGSALYKQKKFDEAAQVINSITEIDINNKTKAGIYHNLGNSLLKHEKYAESIEAYKNALRLNPKDNDTRYNLAYALSKLQQQEQNQSCDNKQDNNEQNEQEQEQNQRQGENDKQEEQKEQQQTQNELSKEDAERILEALEKQEQNVQDKVNKEQLKPVKVIIEKDW